MPNVALSWQAAALLGVACVVFASAMPRLAPRGGRLLLNVAPFGREVGIILGLYALWQVAGGLSLGHTGEAVNRGHWVWRTERTWHFPNEAAWQRPILGHPILVQFCNIYYATMHFGMLLAVLLWLYIRHRQAYVRTRTLIVLTTTACLLVGLVPVAPPRLIGVGMVDTAAFYGQSVYVATAQLGSDQYSAMPSVHVAWAVLVAVAVILATRSRWRWLILLHTAATLYVVTVTANHFWLDGVVAIGLLAIGFVVQQISRALFERYRPARTSQTNGEMPDADVLALRDSSPTR